LKNNSRTFGGTGERVVLHNSRVVLRDSEEGTNIPAGCPASRSCGLLDEKCHGAGVLKINRCSPASVKVQIRTANLKWFS
jgi:hypothetical protein